MNILLYHQYDMLTNSLAELIRRVPAVKNLQLWDGIAAAPDLQKIDTIVLASGLQTSQNIETAAKFITQQAPKMRILGIGTGMLAMARAFKASIEPLAEPMYAASQKLYVGGGETPLFKGISREIQVGCYHRWQVKNLLPNTFVPTVKDQNGAIFGIRHVTYAATGILFHPASALTPLGAQFVQNWLLGK